MEVDLDEGLDVESVDGSGGIQHVAAGASKEEVPHNLDPAAYRDPQAKDQEEDQIDHTAHLCGADHTTLVD